MPQKGGDGCRKSQRYGKTPRRCGSEWRSACARRDRCARRDHHWVERPSDGLADVFEVHPQHRAFAGPHLRWRSKRGGAAGWCAPPVFCAWRWPMLQVASSAECRPPADLEHVDVVDLQFGAFQDCPDRGHRAHSHDPRLYRGVAVGDQPAQRLQPGRVGEGRVGEHDRGGGGVYPGGVAGGDGAVLGEGRAQLRQVRQGDSRRGRARRSRSAPGAFWRGPRSAGSARGNILPRPQVSARSRLLSRRRWTTSK